MKTYIKSILLGTGLLGLFSCSDFLDQSSPSELKGENVFNSVVYTEQALNKVYADLTYDHTYGSRIPINFGNNTDIELANATKQSEVHQNSERGLGNYYLSKGWDKLDTNWERCFAIIENANIVIDGIRNSDLLAEGTTTRKPMLRYLGEALTMRAMVYYDIVKNYGDVPMRFEPTQADGSNMYAAKTDRDVILDQLLDDLDEAANYLPWAGEDGYTTEHATAGFAHGLFARIALSRAGYSIREQAKTGYRNHPTCSDGQFPTQRPSEAEVQKLHERALAHLDIVVSKQVHKLNPSFENQWDLINKRTLDTKYYENLYEVAHGLGRSGEMGYSTGVRINGASNKYGAKGNSSGNIRLTASYILSFDNNDSRRDITCAYYELKQTTVDNKAVIKETLLSNSPFSAYVAKWDIRRMDDAIISLAQNTDQKWAPGINWVVMRYSDILLMYAEVMYNLYGLESSNPNGTTTKTALEALTEVHIRAFDTAAQTAAKTAIEASARNNFMEALDQERAWEFAGECVRKYDLIRWGTLSEKLDQFRTDYKAMIETAPKFIFYKMKSDDPYSIDMNSITWRTEQIPTDLRDLEDPDKVKEAAKTAGYEYVTGWGTNYEWKKGVADTSKTTNDLNLEYVDDISSGLNATIKNRHLLPIGSKTVSDANGYIENSYNF